MTALPCPTTINGYRVLRRSAVRYRREWLYVTRCLDCGDERLRRKSNLYTCQRCLKCACKAIVARDGRLGRRHG